MHECNLLHVESLLSYGGADDIGRFFSSTNVITQLWGNASLGGWICHWVLLRARQYYLQSRRSQKHVAVGRNSGWGARFGSHFTANYTLSTQQPK